MHDKTYLLENGRLGKEEMLRKLSSSKVANLFRHFIMCFLLRNKMVKLCNRGNCLSEEPKRSKEFNISGHR